MLVRPMLAVLLLAAGSVTSTHAQHSGGAAPALATTPPKEAAQYDFLVGQWDLAVKMAPVSLATRIHGMPKLVGTWKAWRALRGFGIEDEIEITDDAGNPRGLTTSIRIYDPGLKRWTISALDVYRARFTTLAAEWKDGEMVISSDGTDPEGKPYRSRVRLYAITPTSFKYQQDRSSDGGKTWKEAVLRMEATRTAAVAPR